MRRSLVVSLLLLDVLFNSGQSSAHDAVRSKSDEGVSAAVEVSRSAQTMNRQVLDLHARYQTADTAGKHGALRALSAAAAAREQYLAGIIAEQPAEVIRAAVSARSRA